MIGFIKLIVVVLLELLSSFFITLLFHTGKEILQWSYTFFLQLASFLHGIIIFYFMKCLTKPMNIISYNVFREKMHGRNMDSILTGSYCAI